MTDYNKAFTHVMKTQNTIALATTHEGKSNVRIVNFYYHESQRTLYFSSFGDNHKIKELEQNSMVAFTTIPIHGENHVRVKNAIVQKSTVPISQIKDLFLSKIPQYIMSIPEVIGDLVLYEIHLTRAEVVIDFEHMGSITL